MGINLKTVDTLARYVEHSVSLDTKALGVFKSALHTKPSILQNKEFKNLKPLLEDVFTRKNTHFAKMTTTQRELLPKELHNTKMGKKLAEIAEKIRYRKVEHAYFVDERGKVLGYQKLGKINGDFTKENIALLLQAKQKGSKIGTLHNHPTSSTLSGDDLHAFNALKMDHIMATTPSGGYASLSRGVPFDKMPKNLDKLDIHNYQVAGIQEAQYYYRAKLEAQGLTNQKIFEEIHKLSHEQIKIFVNDNKDFKYLYDYKTGYNVAKKVPQFPKIDLKKDFIDAGVSSEEAENIVKEIYKAPVEDFYVFQKSIQEAMKEA